MFSQPPVQTHGKESTWRLKWTWRQSMSSPLGRPPLQHNIIHTMATWETVSWAPELGFAKPRLRIRERIDLFSHAVRQDKWLLLGQRWWSESTYRAVFSPSWIGDRGPLRVLMFGSEVFTEVGAEPNSSGEQLLSWNSSFWRPLIVEGWMGSSTDDVQFSSFSCSPPPSSSSSSSSIPSTRWSFALVSSTGGSEGRASSNCKLWARLGGWTLSCPASCPGRMGSVWVDLSSVAGLGSIDTGIPMWPLGLATMLSDSWLEMFID